MKKKMVYGVLVLFFAAFVGAPALYAEEEDSLLTEEGSRPPLSEGVDSSEPEVGASGPLGVVVDQDEENASDPSAFDGDSAATPGERAPEELPMSDTPVGGGVGID